LPSKKDTKFEGIYFCATLEEAKAKIQSKHKEGKIVVI
jgi:hypothetical protein